MVLTWQRTPAFSIKGCSPARMPPDGRASRQKSSNLPTRYTFSVHCAWIGKKAGKAERIYAFMVADSDSIISLKYCNCYFSWLVYSETANHSVRGQSLPWKGQWMDFGQGERRKSIKNIKKKKKKKIAGSNVRRAQFVMGRNHQRRLLRLRGRC